MAVLRPMPIASVSTASSVNPGDLSNWRNTKRRSVVMAVTPRTSVLWTIAVDSHRRIALALASRGPSVDLQRLLAQLPAQDLADIVLRQFIPELHQPRNLVGREARPA